MISSDNSKVSFEELNNFLKALQRSGIVNMMGCAPYIQTEFGVDRYEAKKLAKLWLIDMPKRKQELKELISK